MNVKVYVAVRTDFAVDGTMFPREITWEDGTVFEIDRVLDIRQAPALKAGGQGDRYTVMINGQQSYFQNSFSSRREKAKLTTITLRSRFAIISFFERLTNTVTHCSLPILG